MKVKGIIFKILLFATGIFVGIFVLAFLGQTIFNATYKFPQKITYGVTFSPKYAEYLSLDWKQIYIESLDELNIKNLRLPTYWSDIEKKMEEFNFEDVDFMIDEAEKRGAKVILVVGFRQPRWPECYIPFWARRLGLKEKRANILQFIQKTIERYEDREIIWAYQIENEPFLMFFGEDCDKGDEVFLKTEVDLVRSSSNKSIIVSDSGELGNWIIPMQLSDIFGTTLYRDVYNPLMGNFSYPIFPYLYNLKSQIVKNLFAKSNQKTIIVELQSEPWIGTDDLRNNPQKQAQFFPVKKLKKYMDYARKTGFDTQYLWGVEWWYWMRKHNNPQYLEFARKLFN